MAGYYDGRRQVPCSIAEAIFDQLVLVLVKLMLVHVKLVMVCVVMMML